jgi:hypothetical protein
MFCRTFQDEVSGMGFQVSGLNNEAWELSARASPRFYRLFVLAKE